MLNSVSFYSVRYENIHRRLRIGKNRRRNAFNKSYKENIGFPYIYSLLINYWNNRENPVIPFKLRKRNHISFLIIYF